ncbi:YiiX/YebB-like N1pC/P60 family cysteine hydrolase [Luteolibacter luteus]|uniref:Permuted papain-like amidase YaeF/Yiix C92 family enzyme n=1 Tax=Luteolibacter luteus TaxID=2728835 RepID=A0A858RIB8_9BACT|nr:YiiX/YebB-like N1pC/P60 family cysteine hydrolase [Luteolibacter luteus]QJE96592.1 hypothetical protein HHL09_12625 [Luteolibacter luteus]
MNQDPEDLRISRAAQTVLGASLAAEVEWCARMLAAAEARGYFDPLEDEDIKLRYAQYLRVRAVLLEVLALMEEASGKHGREWEGRLAPFVTAFAAACLLVRGSQGLARQAGASRLLRKKLDEADPVRGIPRKTFTSIYRASTDTLRITRFSAAADFYYDHRSEIASLAGDPLLGGLAQLLVREEDWLGGFRSGIIRRRFAYRWFSFRRRHHSAWKKSLFGIFEWSGRAIAELRQPGVKASGAPKRVSSELRERALELARPGDIFVTRHDDALSNLFLPGFWPHAALYLGSPEQRVKRGVTLPPPLERLAAGPIRFLEAKKDGVLARPAEETLAVDAFVILRPPLDPGQLAAALVRAMDHHGKPYDFSFDFRKSDRLVCTEVIYRAYHGCGPLSFELKEVSARPCLPAEELVAQSLELGFRVVAACGVGRDEIVTGSKAELILHSHRSAL